MHELVAGIPWLVFEYMQDGNLLEYVMRKKDHVKEVKQPTNLQDLCKRNLMLIEIWYLCALEDTCQVLPRYLQRNGISASETIST